MSIGKSYFHSCIGEVTGSINTQGQRRTLPTEPFIKFVDYYRLGLTAYSNKVERLRPKHANITEVYVLFRKNTFYQQTNFSLDFFFCKPNCVRVKFSHRLLHTHHTTLHFIYMIDLHTCLVIQACVKPYLFKLGHVKNKFRIKV